MRTVDQKRRVGGHRRDEGPDAEGHLSGIGLVLPVSGADDHFVAALARGLAEPLIAEDHGVFIRVVSDPDAEERLYRHWATTEGISGVAVLGAGEDDPRRALLRSLELPYATVAGVDVSPSDHAVVIDMTASVDAIHAFLTSRRHPRTVYVTGPHHVRITPSRIDAVSDRYEIFEVDRDEARAVSTALAVVESGPATLLFDSDTHATAAVAALLAAGATIPDDAAIVSWTDSALCRSGTPAITALDRRGGEIGRLLGELMRTAIGGRAPVQVTAPTPFVVRRETT